MMRGNHGHSPSPHPRNELLEVVHGHRSLQHSVPARVWDYVLGGDSHNKADRTAATDILTAEPLITNLIWHTRAFMHRVVMYCLRLGVRQVLDLGCGLPGLRSIHTLVADYDDARMAYVDCDPAVVKHGSIMIERTPAATMVHHDLTDVPSVLDKVTGVLDITEPILVSAAAVLHHVTCTDTLLKVLADYGAALAGGSHVALAHVAGDAEIDFTALASHTGASVGRSADDVERLLSGTDLVEPGVVSAEQWHPDLGPTVDGPSGLYVALGRVEV